jgi:hypothetical protein
MVTRTTLLGVLAILTGCAFGQKISYRGTSNFRVPDSIVSEVALAVSDKRADVVAGSHSREWVGISRPPLGIPYGVHTQSGLPLSDDFASLIQATLAKSGVTAMVSHTEPTETRNIVIARLSEFGIARNLLITLNDWRTDSYVGLSVSLYYSVNLEVTDSLGEQLGISSRAGRKKISGSYPLSQAVTDIFGELFNDLEVKRYLQRKR